jgi:crotonobetainyl-CoA:carnitine CoA-transferase CaiB-like acyl-CoA transferase
MSDSRPSPPAPGPSRPLEGVRVLDLTSVLMGPVATLALADLGADVIKVEPPGGDIMRHGGYMKHEGMGSVFLHANRNKRSIVINLKVPEGREALLALARAADVLIHNVRPDAMKRLGLDYPDLAAVNPRIIYLALVGFDQRGPYASLPAYDDVIQGASGLASLHATASGGAPAYVPLVIVDRLCGIQAAQTALAALFMRERTSRGQYIELPMFETMVQLVLADHLGGETFDPPAGPMGYPRLLTPHRRPFRTRDGYIALLVYTDAHWRQFFDAIGQPETLQDPRFATASARSRHYDSLYAILSDVVAQRTTAEWVGTMRERDIPCMPVQDFTGLKDDAHLQAIGFFQAVDHPSEGKLRAMRVVARWSDADLSTRRHAPRAGEQSIELLREAGYDDASIEHLIAEGVIIQATGDERPPAGS